MSTVRGRVPSDGGSRSSDKGVAISTCEEEMDGSDGVGSCGGSSTLGDLAFSRRTISFIAGLLVGCWAQQSFINLQRSLSRPLWMMTRSIGFGGLPPFLTTSHNTASGVSTNGGVPVNIWSTYLKLKVECWDAITDLINRHSETVYISVFVNIISTQHFRSHPS